jgi:hypothetical protein
MAAYTMCQDIVGICLVLAKGDTRIDFEQVMLEADEFQKRNSRAFGIEPTCLRGVFFTGLRRVLGGNHPLAQRLEDTWRERTLTFKGIQPCEIIPVVLPFFDAHFCDEGDYWTRPEELPGRSDVATREEYESSHGEWWYGYKWEEYHGKLQMKREMSQLFVEASPPQPEAVRQFMRRHGLDDSLLHRCSTSWEWS